MDDVYIRRLDGVSIPRDTEHPIAAGLNDEFVIALYLHIVWDDILHATVASKATSYAWE